MSSNQKQKNIMLGNSKQMKISPEDLSRAVSLFGGKPKVLDDIIPDVNDLNTDDIFRLADLHFYKKFYMFRHLPDSYNKFIEEDVKNYLEYEEHPIAENITNETMYKYYLTFRNIRVQGPMLSNNVEPLFPSMARHQNLTYSVKIFADVTQYQDVIDISSDAKKTNIVGTPEKDQLVAIIPLMVRSKWCSLTVHKGVDKNECEYDPGGYFIVKGGEKVVICQDRIIDNKPTVFMKKDTGAYVQVHSKSYRPNGNSQLVSIRFGKDNQMIVRVPILNEVNVMILLKALGLRTDKNIIEYTTYDVNDTDMIEVIRHSLDGCKTDKGVKISTQEDAVDYLLTKIKILRKYNEKDRDIKHMQKKQFLITILKNNLLPHVNGGLMNKAYYLGYMINRLLKVHLKRISPDDRDSYLNKRIDLVGDLMFELYRQQHKKMMGECKRFFFSRNKSNSTPINIINNIKPNIIETGINGALGTGHWIRRQGVSQILQRLSYLYTISLLRRIDAPGGDDSTAKLTTAPRHLHPSSIAFLCCVTGDSKILMADGTVKEIRYMENGDMIKSVDPFSLKEIDTPIKNFFSRENQEILKITTITGRELKCTLDHPLLVSNNFGNMMVDAGDLKVGDKIIIRPDDIFQEYTNYCHQRKDKKESIYSFSEFKNVCLIMGNYPFMEVAIESIEKIGTDKVYDFTTIAETHTLIANGFVTSNCIETPEHAKIGLTKHLALISSITIMSREQYVLIQDYLMKSKLIMKIDEVSPGQLRNYNMYKVLLNGDWIGLTEKFIELAEDMQRMKLNGLFDSKFTSIVVDNDASELRVYCDSGRLYRPVLKAEDNIVNLKKFHIAQISFNRKDKSPNKIFTWEDFLLKHPNVIEYIDMELQPYLMIADKIQRVEGMRRVMIDSIDKVGDVRSNAVTNRYNDLTYVKYTHCEIHPSLLIGEIMVNVPFCNRNPGPRNIFQFAQGRQAMTIYATNYRKRLDISFILYKPQRSLVHTRASVYTNTRHLPTGENCIVAICTYTG
jgi:DNA-directed RNA polymerase II subunit RPB2